MPEKIDQIPVRIHKKRRSKKLFIVIAVLVLLVAALGATSVVMYKKYQDLKRNPEAATQDNVENLVNKVGKLIKLPDETPTVAVVQDKEKLKNQAFFSEAENGDQVLIFTAAKQAIIYLESENRLINVGPVSIQESQGTVRAASTKPGPA